MKTYRTTEQFLSIVENCINGNWSDAANECIEYGFYAQDLINKHNEADMVGFETFNDATDIALVSEMAASIRFNN